MLRQIRSKRGVSVIIGYVLLISLAVVMGGLMYTWMKSYVPKEKLECEDGTSLLIKDYSYNCATDVLTLTILNNGRFNVGGYFIYASNDSNENLGTINLQEYLVETLDGFSDFGRVQFNRDNNNSFTPNSVVIHNYSLSAGSGTLNFVEITPGRYELQEGRTRFSICGAATKIKQNLQCT